MGMGMRTTLGALVWASLTVGCGDDVAGGAGGAGTGGEDNQGGDGGAAGGAASGGAGGAGGGLGGLGTAGAGAGPPADCPDASAEITVDDAEVYATVVSAWYAPGTNITLCFDSTGYFNVCNAELSINPMADLATGVAIPASCNVEGLEATTLSGACTLTMTQTRGRWVGSFEATVSGRGATSYVLAGAFDTCPGGATD
jgi:hypothetical protein